jgi:hypothetical protein
VLGLAFALAPTLASANAMIPYMAVPWGQLVLFPLVIFVEAIVFWVSLGGRFLSVLGQSFIANLASTLVGAALYLTTMGVLQEPLFHWWFKGALGTDAIRSACIALGFASTLWLLSWLIESFVVARVRRKSSMAQVLRPCAIANVVTYSGLLLVALALHG